MKNIFNGLIIRVDMAEERISKLEDIPVQTIQTKLQRKKKKKIIKGESVISKDWEAPGASVVKNLPAILEMQV